MSQSDETPDEVEVLTLDKISKLTPDEIMEITTSPQFPRLKEEQLGALLQRTEELKRSRFKSLSGD